jgi:hypothetical protein
MNMAADAHHLYQTKAEKPFLDAVRSPQHIWMFQSHQLPGRSKSSNTIEQALISRFSGVSVPCQYQIEPPGAHG